MRLIHILLLFSLSLYSCEKSFTPSPIDLENGFLPSQDGLNSEDRYNVLERMNHFKIPGASIAMVENGEIKWAKGFGIANSQNGSKVDIHTRFQAASISKPLAALASLKLVEESLVQLDTDLNNYLKSWKVPENECTEVEKVTLRRLLTHTSGIPVHGFAGYRINKKLPTTEEVLSGKGNSPKVLVKTIPGTEWSYSGGGFTVMQKLVEDVTGVPFDVYADKNVLEVMGMNKSTFNQPLSNDQFDNVSAAYNKGGKLIKGLWHNYPEQAAAGLWTTPSDLAQYCIEIQDILKGKKEGVLSKQIVEEMLTKHQGDWGLGIQLQGEGDSLVFRHNGKNKGFTNELIAFAHSGTALVILTNGDNGGELIGEIVSVVASEYGWGFDR